MKVVLLLGTVLLVSGAALILINQKNPKTSPDTPLPTSQATDGTQIPKIEPKSKVEIIAQNLDTPWGIAFLPNGNLLVTERPGRIRLVDTQQGLQEKPIATISRVQEISEGGLLGIAVDPNFSQNSFIYVYYTYKGDSTGTRNRVSRMMFKDSELTNEKIVLDEIPGAPNHNGGRIAFGPDGFLYITTGDAQNPSQAQQTNSLAGKILRVTDVGKPAPGNPFNNSVFSYGHRNPQGIVWDAQGRLWSTEHGRSGILSGLDEVNKIEPGKNYGWPTIQGDEKRDTMTPPYLHSGNDTWAPASAAIVNNRLFFGGLRGAALYEIDISQSLPTVKEHFKNELGRIRDVVVGPDGFLYITTSNHDSRGDPKEGDDKIIKIDPAQL